MEEKEKTIKVRASLSDWDDIYTKIEKALPIVEANSKNIEDFAEKVEGGMIFSTVSNSEYPGSSVVKALILAGAASSFRNININYIRHYLKDNEETAKRLGFTLDLWFLRNNIFQRIYTKIKKKGLEVEFLKIVKKIFKLKKVE